MRERLFKTIFRLEENDWHAERPLMKALRDVAENATQSEVATVLAAFGETSEAAQLLKERLEGRAARLEILRKAELRRELGL